MDHQQFAQQVLERVARAVEEGTEDSMQSDIDRLVKSFTEGTPDNVSIAKVDEDQRMVWGWGLVSVEKGQPVTDRQGDLVDTGELQQAVHNSFMENGRVLKKMHSGKRIGEVVDSIVFTKDVQKALGIDLGREGWFVGARIDDPTAWQEVKSGKLPAFSIGGSGERHAVDKRVPPLLFKRLLNAVHLNEGLRKTWSDAARAAAEEARRTHAHGLTQAGDTTTAMHAHDKAAYGLRQYHLDPKQRTATPHDLAHAKAHDLSSKAHFGSWMKGGVGTQPHEVAAMHMKASRAWAKLGHSTTANAHASYAQALGHVGKADKGGQSHDARSGRYTSGGGSASAEEMRTASREAHQASLKAVNGDIRHGAAMSAHAKVLSHAHSVADSKTASVHEKAHAQALSIHHSTKMAIHERLARDSLNTHQGDRAALQTAPPSRWNLGILPTGSNTTSYVGQTEHYSRNTHKKSLSFDDLLEKADKGGQSHDSRTGRYTSGGGGSAESDADKTKRLSDADKKARDKMNEAHLKHLEAQRTGHNKGVHAANLSRARAASEKASAELETHLNAKGGSMYSKAPASVSSTVDTAKYPLAAKGQFVAVNGLANSKGQVSFHRPDGNVEIRQPNGGVAVAHPSRLIPAKQGATRATPQLTPGGAPIQQPRMANESQRHSQQENLRQQLADAKEEYRHHMYMGDSRQRHEDAVTHAQRALDAHVRTHGDLYVSPFTNFAKSERPVMFADLTTK